MSDGLEDIDAEVRPKLEYPFDAPPERGRVLEVAPGIHWLRLPLPFALNHINLWAIADDDGWALVDTGLRSDDTMRVWRELFANASDPRPLTRVFVTHMHPDHIGMAGWLTRKFGARLWMTRLEYLTCRTMVADTGREAPADGIGFYRRAGWGPESIESYRVRFGNFGKYIHTLPDSYRRLRDGEELRIGAHTWRVVVGNGHSPEHACFHCPALKVLISGDQVLPRISSNVSVYPTEPDADPMADWYASLAKVKQEVPDDVLVLPSHNECFRGLHARIDALKQGQDRAFERLRRTLAEPKRAIDVFGALFGRSISEADVHLLGMATGESIACLNHLVLRGEVRRETDANGVDWYRCPEPARSAPAQRIAPAS
ncbi:MBL fold metallo-hydrolase [Verminephrobacter eiseniae]|uniref:Beta-lactamase domain protein n=1 Tax=Verminephrobacter eiseniae (strain EF01-2) TaxID=391735 RepID=A1WKK6_VEREI|nr:MBL fold metallo-hydrolase [Verminephrobacter eiseniae]ABM58163.1 beta-lactamase domain protein [Verminephrobacter eiseniae EF01-2]MCW5263170.1 MBL fold metallo-hydrolase [Verminephrobacter eiseniae]MCW5283764.1 MBL fold metallo-hydrolase [Verminephrobacter eiseniae]MCW5301474.1 MBL fold metallo-hydrolase [Verminephrobacter eiseniae]MCW8179972.1 MBL fold metallo-hydrolase [Verminephrobacter eiseniae]